MPDALLRHFAAAAFLDRGRPWAALIGEETGMMENAFAGIEPLTRFDGRLLKGSTSPSGAVPGVGTAEKALRDAGQCWQGD